MVEPSRQAMLITGASSFAARPLLHALLRRQPPELLLCDHLNALAALQAELTPWCEQQAICSGLHFHPLAPTANPSPLPPGLLAPFQVEGWLLHGHTLRANSLLQHNSCAAVLTNICATQQLLASLPSTGVPLVLISSHLASDRHGMAGFTLAAAEVLVANWAAEHPSCPVQLWRLPSVFDPEARQPADPNAPSDASLDLAWQRESLAEQFVDQLSRAQDPIQCLITAALSASCPAAALQAVPLPTAILPPARPIEQWLSTIATPLAQYDNEAVAAALGSLWS